MNELFKLLKNIGFVIILFACTNQDDKSNVYNWEKAQWIGYTSECRDEKWSTRDVVFNRPPADISTWMPTEKELKAKSRTSFPASLLRKSFTLNQPIRNAKIAICGLGLHELYANGKRIGDRVLDPAQTSYDKRAFYVVYDVTNQLNEGENAIGIVLGNGFYGQNIAFAPDLSYGAPRAKAILNIEYSDGKQMQIGTDESWKAAQSPILFDNIYMGETYDARKEIFNWSGDNYDDSAWEVANIMESATDTLLEQQLEPMRKIREVKPVKLMPSTTEDWIIDMGINMTGWLQITLNEMAGTTIKMQFAEHLMPDGKNIDPASTGIHATGGIQTDIYICSGGGDETWEPRFTYHGFRYVQISGLSQKPQLNNFTGWLIRTDMERIGTFECSDPLIQKFYDVSLLTLEDNLQGLLSDCPHRERCAWMGDAHAVGEFASLNFDMQKMWRKTVGDIKTVKGLQRTHPGDNLPNDPRAPCNISVGKRLCLQARPDWGAATVLIPWFNYLYYGDLQLIKDYWPTMTGWMDYLEEFAVKNGIIYQGYGDWCPPGGNEQKDTPVSLTSTALYYRSLKAMQKMASDQGMTELADDYSSKAEIVKYAFNSMFFKEGDYGSQTGNAFALQSDLVPDNNKQQVADMLVKRIEENGGYHTGIFGHRPLYTLLNDYGHDEITKLLWRKTDWPSLGFMTEKHGLTTWPEVPYNWEPGKRYLRNSFNHPMQSGFAAAFHESIGGIRPDFENPGFKKFVLKPCFLSGLNEAKASFRSPYGLIVSEWKKEGNSIVWKVEIPKGSKAKVDLNNTNAQKVMNGSKEIEIPTFELKSGTWELLIERNKE